MIVWRSRSDSVTSSTTLRACASIRMSFRVRCPTSSAIADRFGSTRLARSVSSAPMVGSLVTRAARVSDETVSSRLGVSAATVSGSRVSNSVCSAAATGLFWCWTTLTSRDPQRCLPHLIHRSRAVLRGQRGPVAKA